MAKQFVEGNVYVFTSKKYLQRMKEIGGDVYPYHKKFNGKTVVVKGINGYVEGNQISENWCKCIKENVSKKVRKERWKQQEYQDQ